MKKLLPVLALLVVACATQLPLAYEPLDERKFPSQVAKDRALQIATNKCNAEAIQVATARPLPTSAPQTTVTINTRSTGGGGFFGGLAEGMANADAQHLQREPLEIAKREREAIRRSTFSTCMNREGWIQKRNVN